jgi:two-component system cell cycle response regulator DivK
MKVRVLLVEDNFLNRMLARDILLSRGHEIVEAGSADEAKAKLAGFVPDIILLDVQIPGGGGQAVLSFIRSRPALAAIPVVAVTALAMPGDKERLLASGFDFYISKPIDTRGFGPTVESFVAKNKES